jgi:hypothetical protein
MNISVVTGARDVAHASTEKILMRDVEAKLQELEPSAGPLTTILMKLETVNATQVLVEWEENQLLPDFDNLTVALTDVAVSMTVANFAYYRKGDLVKINDYETVLVSATPTANPVSITRAYGSIAAVAAPNLSRVYIVSDAGMENDSYRDRLTTQKIPKYNYVQDVATPFEITRRMMSSDTFIGKERPAGQRTAMIEQKKKFEKMIMHGQPYNDTTGTYPRTTSAGLDYFLQTNVRDFSGGFTEPGFEDWLRTCFRYGSDEKLLFCSPKLIQSINGFARGKLRTYVGASTFGVTITKYENAGRKIGLIEEKLLTNLSLNDLTGIAGMGYLVDPAYVKLCYMQGNGNVLEENLQLPGQKGIIDEVRATVGFKLFLEQAHGELTGVQD